MILQFTVNGAVIDGEEMMDFAGALGVVEEAILFFKDHPPKPPYGTAINYLDGGSKMEISYELS